MKLPSSIFSFETLAELPRPSRSLCIALALLVALEAAARVAIARGDLEPDPSLHQLTESYLDDIRSRRPSIWLVGNSVAGRGVDAGIVARPTTREAIVLAHGSASAAGSEAMARFYLDRAPYTPEEVVFCFSKDDFNRNGQRAAVSLRYRQWAAEGPPFDFDRISALSAARGGIIDAVQLEVARLLLPFGDPKRRSATAVFDGRPIRLDDPQYLDTVRDYRFDEEVIERLAGLGKARGANVRVVLMPVTDRYVEFHNRLFPRQTYASIRERLASACRAGGIEFFDHGGPSGDYALFKDPYHLNDEGKRRVSAVLAQDLFSRGVLRVSR